MAKTSEPEAPTCDVFLRQRDCPCEIEKGRRDYHFELEIVENGPEGPIPMVGPVRYPYTGIKPESVEVIQKILQECADAIRAEEIPVSFFGQIKAWLTDDLKITGLSYVDVVCVELLLEPVQPALTDMGIEHGIAKGYDMRKAEALRKKLRGK